MRRTRPLRMDRISRQNSVGARRGRARADRRGIRSAALALLLGLAIDASGVALVSAQDASVKAKPPDASTAAPIAPARPAVLAPPQAAVAAAPAQTPEPSVANTASPPPWTPGKLLQLPPYTRARMHECALEWQQMKERGATAEKIWFTFAQSCLVR
jgi:hypothetical protein